MKIEMVFGQCGGGVYTFPQSNTYARHNHNTLDTLERKRRDLSHICTSIYLFYQKRPHIQFFRIYQRSHLQMLNEMIGLKGTNLREIQKVMR